MSSELREDRVDVRFTSAMAAKAFAKLKTLTEHGAGDDFAEVLQARHLAFEKTRHEVRITGLGGRDSLQDNDFAFFATVSPFAKPASIVRAEYEGGGTLLLVLGEDPMRAFGAVPAFDDFEKKAARSQTQTLLKAGPQRGTAPPGYWTDALYDFGHHVHLVTGEMAKKKSLAKGNRAGIEHCLKLLQSYLIDDEIRFQNKFPQTASERAAFHEQLASTLQALSEMNR